jgi:hypothetical protein
MSALEVCRSPSVRLCLTVAGTGIALEVLFDALVDGGLDWKAAIPKIDGQGPLVIMARTNQGYVAS